MGTGVSTGSSKQYNVNTPDNNNKDKKDNEEEEEEEEEIHAVTSVSPIDR